MSLLFLEVSKLIRGRPSEYAGGFLLSFRAGPAVFAPKDEFPTFSGSRLAEMGDLTSTTPPSL